MHARERKYHRILAEYFERYPMFFDEKREKPNVRKVVELPWQQAQAGMSEELEKTLMDFLFLQAKVDAGMVQGLIEDYGLAPDLSSETKLVGGAVRLSSHVVSLDKEQLAGQLLGRLLDRKEGAIISLLGGHAGIREAHG
jgi:hypothetical protein